VAREVFIVPLARVWRLVRIEDELEADVVEVDEAGRDVPEDEQGVLGDRAEVLRGAHARARGVRAHERVHVHLRISVVPEQKGVCDWSGVARVAYDARRLVPLDVEREAVEVRAAGPKEELCVVGHHPILQATAACVRVKVLVVISQVPQHEAGRPALDGGRRRGRRRGRW